MKHCKKCNSKLDLNTKFCTECGADRMPESASEEKPGFSIKAFLPVAIGIVTVLAVAALWLGLYFSESDAVGNNNHDGDSQFDTISSIDFDIARAGGLSISNLAWDGIETLHYEYHDDVTVIENVPFYTIVESDGVFIITIRNPTEELMQLSVGERFVFEPTAENPRGLSGTIITIASDADTLVMTVKVPDSLDEIFSEFELVGDIELLHSAGDLIISDELKGLSGVEVWKNPIHRAIIDMNNVDVGGVTLNGSVQMLTPRLNVSLNLQKVDHLIVTAGVNIDLRATRVVEFDRIINLFTIPVSLPKGIHVDVPVGIRVNIDGEVSLTIGGTANAQFGVNQGEEVRHLSVNYSFDGNFRISIELSANVKALASVFFIPIYGVEGDFGIGLRSDSQMMHICQQSQCIVVGLYNVAGVRSSKDFGLLRFIRWDIPLANSNDIIGHRFITDGRWLNVCPHGGSVQPDDTGHISGPLSPESPLEISPAPNIPSSGSQGAASGFVPFGAPVTIDEARQTPGVYIKNGDMFMLINPHWTGGSSNFSPFRSEIVTLPQGMTIGNISTSVLLPLLYEADFSIPQIPNNAQLVVIGITNISIREILLDGWTIPVGLAIGGPSSPVRNPYGWIETSDIYTFLNPSGGHTGWNRTFDDINGVMPLDFSRRMIYTGYRYLLASRHGVLDATRGEQFTFSWWAGTERIQRTYTADKRLILIDGWYSFRNPIPIHHVNITDKGYFEIEFIAPPVGIHSIGDDKIVEFVAP